jgi:glutamate-1-semialdehyde 2,1-aminomutase
MTVAHAGTMWGFFFRAEPVRSFADAKTADVARFKRFFHAALDRGVYLAPSAFEAAFMSAAHGDAEIDLTLERLDAALAASA